MYAPCLFCGGDPSESDHWQHCDGRQGQVEAAAFEFEGPADDDSRTARLTAQLRAIRDLMLDGQWRTLAEIEQVTGFPQASISAQLRHLRKRRFGSYVVEKQHVEHGLWQYRVAVLVGV